MEYESYREFDDRIEFDLEGKHLLEEFLCVSCPECGETTMRILTSYIVTYYVHVIDGTNHESYCQVERGSDLIPDALLYTPYEGVPVISITEGLW